MRRSDYKNNAESSADREPYRLGSPKEVAEKDSRVTPVRQSTENKELSDALLAVLKQERGELSESQGTPAQATPVQDAPKEPKKKRKGWLIAIITAVLLIVSAVVIVFVWKPWKTGEEEPIETTMATAPVETTVEVPVTEKTLLVPGIEEDIVSIFINSERSDVSEECPELWVSSMYERISDAEMNGEDTSNVRAEIQTIELFLQHRRTLEGFINEEQPLNAGVIETVQGIKVATEQYCESGLKNTINLEVQGIMDDYDLYSSLKAELEAITDYASYEVVAGTAKVNLVKHTPNRDELSVMLELVSSNQDLINAESAIAELAESEDEEAKTAANNAKATIEATIASLNTKLQQVHALVEGEEYVEPTTEATNATETSVVSESVEGVGEGSSEP